jgi:hypothetical protein
MAWERSFEKPVLQIREKELKFQKLSYTIEVWDVVCLELDRLIHCGLQDFLEWFLVRSSWLAKYLTFF